MAVVRARTSPPYALIIFVILWVISTGFAVYLFVQQGELKKQVELAEAKLPPYLNKDDISVANQLMAQAKAPKPTGFKILQLQKDQVVKAITGKDDKSVSAADAASAEATASIKEAEATIAALKSVTPDAKEKAQEKAKTVDSLIAAVAQLRAYLASADSRLIQLQEAVDAGKAVETELRKNAAEAAEIAKKGSEEKSGAIKRLEDDLAAANAKLPATEQDYQKKLAAQQESYEKQVRERDLTVAQLKQDIDKLNRTVDDLKMEIANSRKGVVPGIPTDPSGKIVRTSMVQNEVTIGIGSADRVVRGLTFVVFDPRSGVRTEVGRDMGKASIEVIEVGLHESLCRITRTGREQRVEIGDVIYNLVFSQQKSRTFRYAVYGDFDLDGDGNSTSMERTRIVRMIEDWGGKVDVIPVEEVRDKTGQVVLGKDGKPMMRPTIRPATDFLVLGTEPADPRDTSNPDLVSSDVIEELKVKRDEFLWVQADGRQSGVTVLNTNRFLNLIGYFNTTLVRH